MREKMLDSCSAPADELQYEHHQRDQKQDMDVRSQHVKANEAQQPQHQQYDEDCPKHLYLSPRKICAFRYGMVRLTARELPCLRKIKSRFEAS